jgi:hypothetical protein
MVLVMMQLWLLKLIQLEVLLVVGLVVLVRVLLRGTVIGEDVDTINQAEPEPVTVVLVGL